MVVGRRIRPLVHAGPSKSGKAELVSIWEPASGRGIDPNQLRESDRSAIPRPDAYDLFLTPKWLRTGLAG